MASGSTNRGNYTILSWLRGVALPTNFYIALCADATTPTEATNIKSDLSECPNGDGYTTGGYSLTKNSTDFDVLTEDDANHKAFVQLKDIVWTATTGNLPISGNGARWAILTDDNATQGSRIVFTWWDLVSNRIVSVNQTLTLQNCELDLLSQ
jgi:hypothetical protein